MNEQPGLMTQTPDAPPPAVVQTDPMALIQSAVEAGQDPATLERLFDLHERIRAQQAKEACDAAVQAFQAECPQIRKAREGAHRVLYASYDDIMDVIRPLLNKHGLAVDFDSQLEGGTLHMTCRVSGHGHTRESRASLPMPKEMKVNDTQRMGAAISYGKRYTICNALNIVVTDEDRDGGNLQADITYMTDDQVFKLEVMLDALEDRKPGTKGLFGQYLQSVARVDSLSACPAKFLGEIQGKLQAKMKEEGLA